MMNTVPTEKRKTNLNHRIILFKNGRLLSHPETKHIKKPTLTALVEKGEKSKGGALKAFSEYPGIKVVASQTANWKTVETLNVFTNILQAHPDLNGVFCANSMMAFGAINAIGSAGKAGQVIVTSYDALDAAKVAIKNGSMLSSVDQRPDLMGR